MDRIKCPFCKEEIFADAQKCRFCGEWLHKASVEDNATLAQVRQAFASHYRVVAELGRGGMAIVYQADQLTLERSVALKVVPREFSHDADFVARFYREAKNSAKLQHPNIVTIHEVGEQGGFPFMALEHLAGGTLSELIGRHGRFSEAGIAEIILPVLEGLSYAHAQGIIHRDLKSSNIMFDLKGRPVIMDFGISRGLDSGKLTKTGTIIGSPDYMSPEQAQGLDSDVRSDIYSIGVVMYEMACGKVPFAADSLVGLIYKVVNQAPELDLLRGTHSDAFIGILEQCLAKQPQERFSTAQALISALRHGSSGGQQPLYNTLNPVMNAPRPAPGNTQTEDGSAVPIYGEAASPAAKSKLPMLIFIIGFILLAATVLLLSLKPKAEELPPEATAVVDSTPAPAFVEEAATPAPRLIGIPMVKVAGGEYLMGDVFDIGNEDEKPIHQVRLSDFFLGQFEVTQGEWKQVMGSNPSTFQGDDRPVENVTWLQAVQFCNALSATEGLDSCYLISADRVSLDPGANGYRLPTEAEWEYAARGGNNHSDFYFAGSDDLDSVSWYGSKAWTLSVGKLQSNELGIHDLSGNIWEWCWDWYASSYPQTGSTNPRGPNSGSLKVLRGGGWGATPNQCRNTSRHSSSPGHKHGSIGFRVCRNG
ncbi:MAG TPA: SUMF1/EgtB/PvdO family nonheme iron enzyme [Candidatus Cloacimonadota bacterium]|nr:SUMF1/EgtB/PvdO family nonheme iron enzyme [Candidatus Cloacimonadota bacterium]